MSQGRSKPVSELKNPQYKNIRIDLKAHKILFDSQGISMLQGRKKTFSQIIIEKFAI